MGVDQTYGRVSFVRVRNGRNIILVTCEKLVELGDFPRIGHSLIGRDEPV